MYELDPKLKFQSKKPHNIPPFPQQNFCSTRRLGRGVAYQGSLCIPQANKILAFVF